MKLPRLLGNRVAWAVLLFIAVLVFLCWRNSVHAAEIDLKVGASVIGGGTSPALGLDLRFPQGDGLTLFAGTILFGETRITQPNWSWQSGFESCRWSVCASLGAAYLQRVDRLNGSHAEFFLALAYELSWHRLRAIEWDHLSNAGTTDVNVGRNAPMLAVRLR